MLLIEFPMRILEKSLNNILRQLSEDSLFNEEGYLLLIQLLALKILMKMNLKSMVKN